jgi:putative nucleotidyltransferase with HDIG domain
MSGGNQPRPTPRLSDLTPTIPLGSDKAARSLLNPGDQAPVRRLELWLTLSFIWFALSLAIMPRPSLVPVQIQAGMTWTGPDVVVQSELAVRDGSAEAALQRQLQIRHPRVFRTTTGPLERASQRTGKFVALLNQLTDVPPEEAQRQIRAALGIQLTPANLQALQAETTTSVKRTLQIALHALLLDRGLTADKVLLETARRDNFLILLDPEGRFTTATANLILGWPGEALSHLETQLLPEARLPLRIIPAYTEILSAVLEPNILYDPQRTAEELAIALDKVRVIRAYAPGTILVRTDDVITPEKAMALLALRDKLHWKNFEVAVGIGLIVAITMVLFAAYVRRFRHDLRPNPRNLLMLALPVIMALSVGRLLAESSPEFLGPLALPVGMVGMVTTITFDARIAFVLAIITPLLFSTTHITPAFDTLFVGMLTGFVGAFALHRIRGFHELPITGLAIAATGLLTLIAVGLLEPADFDPTQFLVPAILNGLGCYGLTQMSIPIFERLLNQCTTWRLLELTSGDHPILNELETKAPGTYEHSLNVAKLAEAACDAIGAEALLARAGAFYHDIGKLHRAEYFIENQITPEQKQLHKKLPPKLSAMIIRDHVRLGVERGRKEGLPENIIQFIQQHHGTTLISYFYNKERLQHDEEGEDRVEQDIYRYSGPRPQTIEVAIVMIADSLDAIAVSKFSGKSVTTGELYELVRSTIIRLFNEEQFQDCPITMTQLFGTVPAFVRCLKSRFHERVDYNAMKRPIPTIPTSESPESPDAPNARGKAIQSDRENDQESNPEPTNAAAALGKPDK